MFGLNSGDGGGHSRQDSVCYRLLERGVYDLGVSSNLFKTGDSYRELVCVCEPERVVRRRWSSKCSCTTLGQGELQKKGRYEEVNEGLQAWIDSRASGTSFISLKLCYHASKRGCFASSCKGTRIQDEDENINKIWRKGTWKRKKNMYKVVVFLTKLQNKLKSFELRYFESTWGNDSATNLSRVTI